MTDQDFAALERRLAHVLAEGGRGRVDRHDVLDLLAECRALRQPPDVPGLMTAAEMAEVRRWPDLPTHRTPKLLAHIDALESLTRELYGVVADLHADDPGRQALLERGRAEGREQAARAAEGFHSAALLGRLAAEIRALGPVRPPLPPHAAEAEAGRLREALRQCLERLEWPSGGDSPCPLHFAYAIDTARKALAGDAP